jgi:hypothetical protein
MKLAVVGSRTLDRYSIVDEAIKKHFKIEEIDLIVSGGADGADRFGEVFAKKNELSLLIHYPKWKKLGRKAGFARNEQIVRDADAVICFWDGVSKGSQNSMDWAQRLGKTLVTIRFESNPVEEERDI